MLFKQISISTRAWELRRSKWECFGVSQSTATGSWSGSPSVHLGLLRVQKKPWQFWRGPAWPEHRGGPAQLFLGSETIQKDSQPLKLHFIRKPKWYMATGEFFKQTELRCAWWDRFNHLQANLPLACSVLAEDKRVSPFLQLCFLVYQLSFCFWIAKNSASFCRDLCRPFDPSESVHLSVTFPGAFGAASSSPCCISQSRS